MHFLRFAIMMKKCLSSHKVYQVIMTKHVYNVQMNNYISCFLIINNLINKKKRKPESGNKWTKYLDYFNQALRKISKLSLYQR